MINKSPSDIWKEHNKCVQFNQNIDLYETIDENNDMFIDNQWEGVNCPDLDLPVFNIFKNPINTFISMIVSNDIAVELDTFSMILDRKPYEKLFSAAEQEIEQIIENEKIKTKNVRVLKNAAIEGDMCLYFYFDPDEEIGQTAKGLIKCEIVEAQNIEFSNPVCKDIQKQPYIIIVMRETLENVKAEAKENGIENWDNITADDTYYLDNDSRNVDNLVTVLVKMWKENKTVKCIKTTQNVLVREEWDTEYSLYPVAFGNWEEVKDCYHGHSCISGMIPNQLFINKTYAMIMELIKKLAFPKQVYNEDLIAEWTNEISALPVQGGENGDIDLNKLVATIQGAQVPPDVISFIQGVISDTRSTMGASDVLLGDVRPDNQGAIIAIQNQSAMPLKLQRMAFEQFVEDYVRILLDMIATDYGQRKAVYIDKTLNKDEQKQVGDFDFSQLKQIRHKINVKVGASTYWSQINQTFNLDNLYKNKMLNPIQYLERLPENAVKDISDVIEELKAQQEAPQPTPTTVPNMDNMADLLKGVV